jgi:hypothetical protein
MEDAYSGGMSVLAMDNISSILGTLPIFELLYCIYSVYFL